MEGFIQLAPQVFSGPAQPGPEMMLPTTNRRDFAWKPDGGLWTSSHTPEAEQASGWLEWCHSEDFRLDQYKRSWLLRPKPAMVYVLRNMTALNDLLAQFPPNLPDEMMAISLLRETLDWEAFAKHYDALWLPSPWSMRLQSMFVYGWDCESTYWCRWCFDSEVVEL